MIKQRDCVYYLDSRKVFGFKAYSYSQLFEFFFRLPLNEFTIGRYMQA